MKLKENRESNYDMLRIVACIAVIVIHANWIYFSERYKYPDGSFSWVLEALLNIITRFSVPVFVMLSGAFNIRDVKAVDFYKKVSYKVFLPTIIIISILALLRICVNVFFHYPIVRGLIGIVTGSYYNLWYMYMLAGLYLLTPLINLLKKNINKKQYRLITVIMTLWAIISQATSSQKLSYSIGVVFAFVSYYMLGDIAHELAKEFVNFGKVRIIVVILNLECIMISYCFRVAGYNYYIAKAYINFFSPAIVVYSISVFFLFSTIKIKIDVSWMSEKIFYIYLFHTFILNILERFIHISDMIDIPVLTICDFCISLMLAVVFDKVWRKICNLTGLYNKWISLRVWNLIAK